MNELKFRVWDNSFAQKFYYDMDDLFENPSVIPSKIFNGEDGLLFINRWTGFQDENGKDIYEGDFIRYKLGNIIYIELVFWEGSGWVTGPADKSSANPLCGLPHIASVIGNKYQNPELLA